MKKLRYIVVLILCLFTFNVFGLRVSHYEPTFEMDEEFQNNKIVTYFGFMGEDTYRTEMKVEFNSDMIELDSIFPGNDYRVEQEEIKSSSGTKIYKLTFTSDMVSNNHIIGGIVFNLTNKFDVKKQSEMKIYDIYAYNDDGSKYRSEGYYILLKRDGPNNMLALRTNINKETNTKRTIYAILPFIIVGIVGLTILAVAFVMIPSTRHSNIKSKIDYQRDPKNYPIPGVGPFPRVKKKEKQDVIEPEEKTIMPLSEFVSKSDESNEELKNKPIEVDEEMFKDNPTKEGEGGLININPLAFDDGEDSVIEDGEIKKDDDDDIDIL